MHQCLCSENTGSTQMKQECKVPFCDHVVVLAANAAGCQSMTDFPIKEKIGKLIDLLEFSMILSLAIMEHRQTKSHCTCKSH